jgi:hypothetical protein
MLRRWSANNAFYPFGDSSWHPIESTLDRRQSLWVAFELPRNDGQQDGRFISKFALESEPQPNLVAIGSSMWNGSQQAPPVFQLPSVQLNRLASLLGQR